ncbi:GIY-YIG nuclease family protein [Tessaracoccus palaemonis]|uniref:GIY-YIG nuclease family protein n=1 Tax=Tessaracoccus palaemonis TaxID=2829499 RepID=A0ABX8SKX3_9ACTN|nr:GIY-YIG nuclease family protein [Tessaracoccus palaemonis]QXT63935.1 GIY-YIG nuclease family protein [Tessaracoccus palaemonis]
MSGKHIELFLVDGEPGGITTAEIAGWTGHVLAGARSDLARILRRDEANRNGAYLLIGEDEDAVGGIQCYIGRTENFAQRIRNHDANKDFWDRVVLISAKDDVFNEGHWGYLEARLVELARLAERSTLPNIQTPQGRRLSEAQQSDMNAFLSQLEIVLPVLGVNVLRIRPSKKAAAAPVEPETAESPVFTLADARHGVSARAQVDGDEFTMLAGSVIVGTWSRVGKSESTRRSYASLAQRHAKLVADGSIRVVGDTGTLTRDVAFSSPSTAGAVALGRSCNGRISWLWEEGTYAQWEARGL